MWFALWKTLLFQAEFSIYVPQAPRRHEALGGKCDQRDLEIRLASLIENAFPVLNDREVAQIV